MLTPKALLTGKGLNVFLFYFLILFHWKAGLFCVVITALLVLAKALVLIVMQILIFYYHIWCNYLICTISCLMSESLEQHRRILSSWKSAMLQYWHILSQRPRGCASGISIFPNFSKRCIFFSTPMFKFGSRTLSQGTNSCFPLEHCRTVSIFPSYAPI